MVKRYRHWLGEDARHMVESFDGDYVLYTDHLAAMSELKDQGQTIVDRYEERLKEKDKEIEQLEAENDNMRKIFDGLMAILPPEYFVKEDDDEVRDDG